MLKLCDFFKNCNYTIQHKYIALTLNVSVIVPVAYIKFLLNYIVMKLIFKKQYFRLFTSLYNLKQC